LLTKQSSANPHTDTMFGNRCFAFVLPAVAGAFGEDVGFSLLQTQAHTMLAAKEVSRWGGVYMKCREAQAGFVSSCRKISISEDKMKEAMTQARYCAYAARDVAASGFNFADGVACEPVRCNSVDMQYVNGSVLENTRVQWEVYSETCGLPRVSKKIESEQCGSVRESYLQYYHPPKKVCKNALNFGGETSGDLKTPDGLRFVEALDQTDLIITALGNYEHSEGWNKKNQKQHFGLLNVKAGTDTKFKFQLVETGTTNPKTVQAFAFTLVDLHAKNGCKRNLKVTATNFYSYHLHENPRLGVKVDPGAGVRSPSVSFSGADGASSAQEVEATGVDDGSMPVDQLERSVTLVFVDRSEFEIEVAVTEGQGGRNLKLAHQLLTDCMPIKDEKKTANKKEELKDLER